MPSYPLKCATCGHGWDADLPMSTDKSKLPCPDCGAIGAAVDWSRIDRLNAPQVGNREWTGKESRSLAMAFDPKHIGDLKRDVPSAELHPDGALKFNSDSHQKRVYREMAAVVDRVGTEREAEVEKFRQANPRPERLAIARKFRETAGRRAHERQMQQQGAKKR